MYRRLYFLFPNIDSVAEAVHDLRMCNISRNRMHALARDPGLLKSLPPSSGLQANDFGKRLEAFLWRGNLLLFFIALAFAIMAAVQGNTGVLLSTATVMLTGFAVGYWFAVEIPHVHLDEFKGALSHHEILLMVDVPLSQVAVIEKRVHERHPQANIGGVGWTLATFNM